MPCDGCGAVVEHRPGCAAEYVDADMGFAEEIMRARNGDLAYYAWLAARAREAERER